MDDLYREVYSAMNQGVALQEVIFDEAGNPVDYKIVDINDSLIDFIGKSREDILGKNISKLMPELQKSWIEKANQVAITGKPIRFEHYSQELNKYFEVDVYSPEKYKFVLLMTDITERKRNYKRMSSLIEELTASEEEIRSNYIEMEHVKNQVEKASGLKSQFLANINHEIRTPLNGIVAFADLLKFTEMNKEQKEYLQMIQECSKHLMNVLDNCLDISKVENGRFSVKQEQFNIKNTLDRLVKEFSYICKHRNLKFSYHLDPHIPLNLLGDELGFNQILVDLLNNMVKFTNEGNINLSVKKIFQLNDKINLQFQITDSGIGTNSAFIHSTSKELVKMMHGEFWVESNENDRGVYYFTAEFLIDVTKIPEQTIKEYRAQGNTVMVVEDNEINMKIVTEMLKKLGCSVISTNNGRDAVKIYTKHLPNIIFMDVQMLKLDGYETTKIIRKNESVIANHSQGNRVPIIGTISYPMPGDRELCVEAGMDDYIVKPFELHKLERIIKNYINQNNNNYDEVQDELFFES